jgi:glycosyltransferase involved in cell wall biosynthesis
MRLIFNGVTLLEGTGGIRRYAQAALAAIKQGPLASQNEVWLPSALAARAGECDWPQDRLIVYPGPNPRRGFSFNQLFWTHCLALHRLRRAPGSRIFSPVETFALLPTGGMVMTAHDCYADRFGDPRKDGRVGLGRRLAVRQLRVSRVLSVSRFTTQELETLHGLKAPQVTTVWNWLSATYDRRPSLEQRTRVRAELGLPERFWLYVGGFRRNKNLPLLLRAYAAALACEPGLPSLVLAGKWPERDTVFSGPLNATLAQLGRAAAARVVRPGFVADADLPALYALADLAICPSSYEGFGYPLVEALAVGTPVLAARAASLPELLPDDELLFAADDPAELTGKLLAARDSAAGYRRPFDEAFSSAAGQARFNTALLAALNEGTV